jgi:hypothetical protein
LLTYQTLRDWGIEKSYSYEKLQNKGEEDRRAKGLWEKGDGK